MWFRCLPCRPVAQGRVSIIAAACRPERGDTSIPIDVGMSEEVDVSDNNWTCYQFKSVDGNLEFIALNHGSNILRIDWRVWKCEIIDSSYVYFNKEGKLFIEHYSYSMKKGEKRLDDARLTDKSFGHGCSAEYFKVADVNFETLNEAKLYCDNHLLF